MINGLLTRLLHWLPPEAAHEAAISLLTLAPATSTKSYDVRLETEFLGRRLPHMIGLAAGFDKDARALAGLGSLGFAGIEVGTVTPQPQPGNPKPRLFRLKEDEAVINRMGFNNRGLDAFVRKLERRPDHLLVGANVGMNKNSANPLEDFVKGYAACASVADYITINISSPNTPGLRDLQEPETLKHLLGSLHHARSTGRPCPIFLKLAPDLETEQAIRITDLAMDWDITGLILTNTTITRPKNLQSPLRDEAGGLSGKPLAALSRGFLKTVAEHGKGRLKIIAAGGITTGEDVAHCLRLGADFVQIYTSFIYGGPGIIQNLTKELIEILDQEGIAHAMGLAGREAV